MPEIELKESSTKLSVQAATLTLLVSLSLVKA